MPFRCGPAINLREDSTPAQLEEVTVSKLNMLSVACESRATVEDLRSPGISTEFVIHREDFIDHLSDGKMLDRALPPGEAH